MGPVIGRGGFGTVHRAWVQGELLRREVAVKLVRPGLAGDPRVEARLRDEARMLACIDHRAVVKVEDVVRLGGVPAVVMELVRGESLGTLVRSHGPMPERAALAAVAEVAGALAQAWQAPGPDGGPLRLLHRDVKPDNILLTAQGMVKLLDFGVAKARLAEREAATTQGAPGTPAYMAPERFDGEDGPAADVYALGATLLELLTGQAPERTSARADRHAEVWAAALERVGGSGAGPEAVALVAEALAHDPAERPTAADLATRCARLAGGGEALARWAAAHVRFPEAPPPPADAADAPAAPAPSPSTGGRQTLVPAEPAIAPTGGAPVRAWLGGAAVMAVVLGLGAWTWTGLTRDGRPATTAASPDAAPSDAAPAAAAPAPTPAPEDRPAEAPPALADPPPAAVAPPPAGRPQPRAPGPEPAEKAPEPEAPTAPAPATIALRGDPATLTLVGEAGRFPLPGTAPAGRYAVEARFGDAAPMTCARLRLAPGDALTLQVDAAFTSCEVR